MIDLTETLNVLSIGMFKYDHVPFLRSIWPLERYVPRYFGLLVNNTSEKAIYFTLIMMPE